MAIRTSTRRSVRLAVSVLSLVLLGILTLSSFSMTGAPRCFTPASAPFLCELKVTAQDVDNLTDVTEFLNGLMNQQMSQYNIRGAHICLVKDATIYFSNGYGFFLNSSGWFPVLADTTLFRVGSLSKAVTATAVMQLVEQGLVGLDTDVNEYLEAFKVPETFTQPITIAHLLSHVSGLENTLAPVYVNSAEDLPSLEEVLSTELPHRIIPPGQAAMYSNFGFALLGYVVEQVSGVAFQDYVRSEIFEPLGMNNTYFEQVLADEDAEQLSGGFHYNPLRGYVSEPREFATIPPAAGLITTAEDYGRFLIAHLNNGVYDGHRILQNDTVQLMHSTHFEARPGMDGVCYGFYERDMNNLEMIGHGGITNWFQATEVMLLEENVGLYVCYNTDSARTAGAELVEAFVNHYYPSTLNISPLEGHEERVNRYVGEYLNSHTYFSTAQKMQLLAGFPFETMRVTENPDGTIRVQRVRLPSSEISYDNVFVEVEPGLFLDVSGDSKDIVAFLENGNGEITHMYFSWFPPEAWIRISSLESPETTFAILLNTSLAGLLYLPLYAVMELGSLWKHRKQDSLGANAVRLLSLGSVIVSLLMILTRATFLLPVSAILILLVVLVLQRHIRMNPQPNLVGSAIRFVSATHYSFAVPALAFLGSSSGILYSGVTEMGTASTWFEIMAAYHATMDLVLALLAAYLIAVVILALLVVFSWTKRAGLNLTSPSSVAERILYTVVLALAVIVVWVFSLWGAFVFVL